MSVAYLVFADRSPAGVASLVERIRGYDDRVFLHVDRRVDVEPFVTALAGPIGRGHVILTRRRVRSTRNSVTPVSGTVADLEQALDEAPFSEFHLVRGESQPAVPVPKLQEVLASVGDKPLSVKGHAAQRREPQSLAVSRDAARLIVERFHGARGALRRARLAAA